ncbi:VOC family protein [Streptomyces sp. TRM66268-LWL]|uniref:VOC family protein n=1 Tax=Streptomyces polyasparticus TaxID=2767826 RepID=A0ABR7STM6_9ACTN|nr:VOC family protein [Streptomyces polyasparticus]MBC9717957.1 VOC family protein [Streptomyces polyasparticus]
MIKGLAISTVWTLDQERTRKFFTEKLGFEVRTDLEMGDMRWVTVGAKDQPDVELALMRPDGPGADAETAKALVQLVAKGAIGAGAFTTDDCRRDYAEFKAKGVEFLQEPQERPYGIEATFRDDNGNWYSLTERNEELDFSKSWG